MGRERVVARLLLVRSGREVEVVCEGGERREEEGSKRFREGNDESKSAVSGSGESLRASYVLRKGATWSRERR